MASLAASGSGGDVFRSDMFAGKVCLITGGGSGIGYTITEEFLRHGAACFIVSRSKDRIEAAAESLRASTGGRVSGMSADVRDPARMKEVAEACVSELGALDILVNSAAGNFLCPASSMSSRAFRAVLDIDTVGTFHATKAAFEAWMSDHGGVVLSITATLHYNAMPMQCHAGSAKAAIEAMMKHIAIEWGPLGIRTACIAPGPIKDTEGFSRLGGFMPQHEQERARRTIPMQRMGARKDIANCCLFLASPAASYVTGTTLVADGGAWMTGYEHRLMEAGREAGGDGRPPGAPTGRSRL